MTTDRAQSSAIIQMMVTMVVVVVMLNVGITVLAGLQDENSEAAAEFEDTAASEEVKRTFEAFFQGLAGLALGLTGGSLTHGLVTPLLKRRLELVP